MQADKGFLNTFVEAIVHGESFCIPVDAVTQAAHLTHNGVAGFLFPLPGFFNKFFSAQFFAAGLALGGQFALYHHLRGDTGVVTAHLPEGVFAFHAVVAG